MKNQRHKQNILFIFNEHVHQAILKIVESQLPLEISARDLDDQKLWEILCHASVKQSFIETSCCALSDAPSGNTVRTHLKAALGDDEQSLAESEHPYRTDVVIACHYAGRKSKRRPKKKKRGLKYYAYAVYGVAHRSPQAISAGYRRCFSIESGYRQLHQVRARTCSRHTGLRMLLVGLALLLVNLYVLLRASWTHLTHYGRRVCHHALTLDDVASALQQEVQRILGFAPEFYCRV